MARLDKIYGSQSEPQGPAPMQGRDMTPITSSYSPKLPQTNMGNTPYLSGNLTPEQLQMAMQLLGKI
jgi:hypothetical protein